MKVNTKFIFSVLSSGVKLLLSALLLINEEFSTFRFLMVLIAPPLDATLSVKLQLLTLPELPVQEIAPPETFEVLLMKVLLLTVPVAPFQ